MPITAANRDRYPADWRAISHRIRFDRAAGRCECAGECGRTHGGRAQRRGRRCTARHGKPHPVTRSRVWLTTAHLDQTPENCDEANLRAMCQRCHLAYDLDQHVTNARRTRIAAETAWMTPLFSLPDQQRIIT